MPLFFAILNHKHLLIQITELYYISSISSAFQTYNKIYMKDACVWLSGYIVETEFQLRVCKWISSK